MSWTEGATKSKLGGGKGKAKKSIREIRTRKGASGGFVHEHHYTDPEANPMEEHVSPDQAGMLQHMAANMGSPDAAGAAPDPNAAAPTPGAAPAMPQSAPTPGAM